MLEQDFQLTLPVLRLMLVGGRFCGGPVKIEGHGTLGGTCYGRGQAPESFESRSVSGLWATHSQVSSHNGKVWQPLA